MAPATKTKTTPRNQAKVKASPRRSPLQASRARREVEENNLQAELAKHKTASIKARYDVLETNKARRPSTRETKDEGQIYDMTRRAHGCNLGRDLERNYSPARALMHQIRVNCVGSLGKMRINLKGSEDTASDAANWFNEVWSKDCDYRCDMNWSDWLQNTLAALIREGDQLTVFDDGITDEDSGKLLVWESDQVAPITANLLSGKYDGAVQDNGILRDKFGKELAYIASGKRGLSVLSDEKDFTIYPREVARLMCNPWRHNQGRGIPSLVTAAANFVDMYELLASELASAKRTAKQYAYVKRTDAVTDWDDPASAPAYLPENTGKDAATVAAEGANAATATGAANYERLEAFAGGLVDYLDKGDEVEIPTLAHPNSNLAPFMDSVHGFSGAALGIASAYTKLRADKSYTAFRGDMVMSWVTFYWWQKRLERIACDWVGVRALGWAQRRKEIAPLPEGWERSLSWIWPTMHEIDELKHEQAVAQGFNNGTTSYADQLGPDWEKRLEAYAAQIEKVRELNLPLEVLEAKSGGIPEPDTQPPPGDEE